MTTEIYLPRLGSTTMEAATVIEWLVSVGETVEEGQILLEVETDKSAVEVPAPAGGTVLAVVAEEGAEVEVGGTLGYLGDPGEAVPTDMAPDAGPVEPLADETAPTMADGDESPAVHGIAGMGGRTMAAPAARRIAKELGVDLDEVDGTGPNGRILPADVEAARAGQAGEPLSALRRRTAKRMSESSSTTAPVTLTRLVDASVIADTRARGGDSVGVLDVVVAAAARVLAERDDVNVRYQDDRLHRADSVSIGVAVQTESVLLVPVIRGADRLALDELAATRRDLTDRAMRGGLEPDDMGGATFTVTNLGGHGIDAFTPIINVPEVAILGVGRMTDMVFAVNGRPTVRPGMWLSLTFDHRIVDGGPAAEVLTAIAGIIESGQ